MNAIRGVERPAGAPPGRGASRWRTRHGVTLIGFLAIGAFFLFSEHRAHALAFLPFVLVGACLLLHLFHGHGSHGAPGARDQARRDDQP